MAKLSKVRKPDQASKPRASIMKNFGHTFKEVFHRAKKTLKSKKGQSNVDLGEGLQQQDAQADASASINVEVAHESSIGDTATTSQADEPKDNIVFLEAPTSDEHVEATHQQTAHDSFSPPLRPDFDASSADQNNHPKSALNEENVQLAATSPSQQNDLQSFFGIQSDQDSAASAGPIAEDDAEESHKPGREPAIGITEPEAALTHFGTTTNGKASHTSKVEGSSLNDEGSNDPDIPNIPSAAPVNIILKVDDDYTEIDAPPTPRPTVLREILADVKRNKRRKVPASIQIADNHSSPQSTLVGSSFASPHTPDSPLLRFRTPKHSGDKAKVTRFDPFSSPTPPTPSKDEPSPEENAPEDLIGFEGVEEEITRRVEARLVDIKAQKDRECAARVADAVRKTEKLKEEEWEAAFEASASNHRIELDDKDDDHEGAVNELKEEHQNDIQAIKDKCQRTVQDLHKIHETAYKGTEARHGREVSKLQGQLRQVESDNKAKETTIQQMSEDYKYIVEQERRRHTAVRSTT